MKRATPSNRKRVFHRQVVEPLAAIAFLVVFYFAIKFGSASPDHPDQTDPFGGWFVEIVFGAMVAWMVVRLVVGLWRWRRTPAPAPVAPSTEPGSQVQEGEPAELGLWLNLFERHALIDAAAAERIHGSFRREYGADGNFLDLLSTASEDIYTHGGGGSLRSVHSNVEAHEGNYEEAISTVDAVLASHLDLRLIEFDPVAGRMGLRAGTQSIETKVETSGKWLSLDWMEPVGTALAATSSKRLAGFVVDTEFYLYLIDREQWKAFINALGDPDGFVTGE